MKGQTAINTLYAGKILQSGSRLFRIKDGILQYNNDCTRTLTNPRLLPPETVWHECKSHTWTFNYVASLNFVEYVAPMDFLEAIDYLQRGYNNVRRRNWPADFYLHRPSVVNDIRRRRDRGHAKGYETYCITIEDMQAQDWESK